MVGNPYIKSVRCRSFSSPYFSALGPENLQIQTLFMQWIVLLKLVFLLNKLVKCFKFTHYHWYLTRAIIISTHIINALKSQSWLNNTRILRCLDQRFFKLASKEIFLKLVSAIFYQIFIFSPYRPSKTTKNIFYFI